MFSKGYTRLKVKHEKEKAVYSSMVYGAESRDKGSKINFHRLSLKNRLSFNHFKTNNA